MDALIDSRLSAQLEVQSKAELAGTYRCDTICAPHEGSCAASSTSTVGLVISMTNPCESHYEAASLRSTTLSVGSNFCLGVLSAASKLTVTTSVTLLFRG